MERLRQEIQVGLDQITAGNVSELDIEKIKAEGRKLLAEQSQKRRQLPHSSQKKA
jgi:hypothetical protein